MNRKNIKRVRDVIAALPPERLDMRYLFTRAAVGERHAVSVKRCNTAACLAGWTLATIHPRSIGEDTNTARKLLDLSTTAGDALFTPPGYYQNGRYTHAMAVRTLDRLLATGEVDWSASDGSSPQSGAS